MPVETTENEIRVRVRQPGEFKRLAQIFPREEDKVEAHWPYNSEGIRGIGGPLKRTGKVKVQAYIFSREEKYNWAPAKAEKWVRDQDETPKGYSEPMDEDITLDFDFEIEAVKSAFDIPTQDRVKTTDGVDICYIEGHASTDMVDDQGEVIDQATIKDERFLKNPIILYQHNPEWPIGKAVRIEKNISIGDGHKGFWIRAAIIGTTAKAREVMKLIRSRMVKAFSVRGKAQHRRRVCTSKGQRNCHYVLTALNLMEVSVVSVPANESTLFEVAKAMMMNIKSNTYTCECIACGHTIQAEEHCKDLKCPECGGQMRRKERPGPGQVNSPGDVGGAGNAETKEEIPMSDKIKQEPGAPPGAEEETPGASDLPKRVEALEALVPKIEALEQKVNALIEQLAKPEGPPGETPPPAAPEGEKAAPSTTTPPAGATAGEPAVVAVKGMKKSVVKTHTGAGNRAPPGGIDVQKSQDLLRAKQMAEALWFKQHPI